MDVDFLSALLLTTLQINTAFRLVEFGVITSKDKDRQ